MWERDPAKSDRFIAAARASRATQTSNIAGLLLALEGRATPTYDAELDRWLGLPNSRRRHAFFAQLKAEIAAYRGNAEGCLDAILASDDLGLTDLLWMDRCPTLDLVRADARFVRARTHVAARASTILAELA
jgi:hypothetical protein